MHCAHSLCRMPVQGDGFPARFRGDVYCSALCRSRHGAVLRQQGRRDAKLDVDTRRARDLRKKYGITVEEWERLYSEQLGRCGICMTPLAERKVCVDHDHETGVVRGLLCNRCNQGLGYFSDSSAMLVAAARYIDSAPKSVGEEVSMR